LFGGAADFAFDRGANEGYVADGFRNRRIAVVDLNTGRIKRFFGAYGAAPDDGPLAAYDPAAEPAKQFSMVRCVERSADGLLYVCDARNNRIQVFRGDGSFVRETRIKPATRANGSVWGVAFSRDPQQRYLYVADGSNMQIHVLDRQSMELLTTFGDGGRYPGQFLAVSGVATDSKGNLYTVEADQGKRLQRFLFNGVGAVSRNQGVLWPR
jgi:DNA-binding beta-propeller fold protein YncE